MIPVYFDNPTQLRDWLKERIRQERERVNHLSLTSSERVRIQGVLSGLIEGLNATRALHPEYVRLRTARDQEPWVGKILEGPDGGDYYTIKDRSGAAREVWGFCFLGPADASEFLAQSEGEPPCPPTSTPS